jgi:hypothetical protein
MITITKVGSLVKIDHEGGTTRVSPSDKPYIRYQSGNVIEFKVGAVSISTSHPLSYYSIAGVVPTTEAEFDTQLATVFPSAAPATALPTETVATYAAMTTSISSDPTTKRDFFVSADETNGGVATRYSYNGTSVNRQPLSANDTLSNVYYMGDSLTDDGTYIYQVSTHLSSSWTHHNKGISGQNTTQMLARFTADVINKKASHVVIFAGTNDVTQLVAQNTITSNLQAMYTAAHNAGIKVIAVTITPRTTTGAQLTIQQAVNTWIKSTATNIDYIVDPYDTLKDPSNPTQLLPAYSSDGLHMTTSGYQVLGDYIYNNATWTAKTITNGIASFGGYSKLNQDVSTNATPVFSLINGITVGRGIGNIYTNTSVGDSALAANTYGKYNTAIGHKSLNANTSGYANTGIGEQALLSNTTGYNNTAIGQNSLQTNTTGYGNTGIGIYALFGNTTGYANTAIGQDALHTNTTGFSNTAIGIQALTLNTTGAGNTAIGNGALHGNTTANNNTALGNGCMYANTTGSSNTAVGTNSLLSNTTGASNTAFGFGALQTITVANNSTAVGYASLQNATGANNTAIGINSGQSITTGTNNSFLGYLAGNNASQKVDATNSTAIGNGSYTTKSNQVVVGNTSITETLLNGNVGFGMTISPTARVHLPAGTATAGTAPLKLTSGTNMTTPEAGAFEFDGTNLYFTIGSTRKTVTLA